MASNDSVDNNSNDLLPPEGGGKLRFELPSAAKERTKYREELLLNNFGKMIHSSATVDQVCDYFQISRNTYYRWIRKVAARERKFVKSHYQDVLVNEITATGQEFKHIITMMNKIMNSEDAAPADKIDAAKLAGEFRLALLQLYGNGAMAAWQTLPHPVRRIISSDKEPASLSENKEEEEQETEQQQQQEQSTMGTNIRQS